ncbi:PREDICTED: zinc finger CCCH-type with G patch domain-containing protein [Nanorana parkeri]|uniref:zinc finger CCCH-type with G patch domain-containing protein n=1 Tax=Nanorana parkeri TaxID=125878 RepID=UPI000854C64D|nr:PREDICTED: zinc finger CCCH-type with G patch domain-containing protein [Nanorana parkeri]
MDEESLAAAVQTYKAQLEQVRQTLNADVDPSQKADLLQLQEDLQQLIELTESSLLSVQKSNLLSSLDGPSSSSQQEDEYESFRRAIGELSNGCEATGTVDSKSSSSVDSSEEEVVEEYEEENETSGMKVRAPYYSTWGTLEYHNAMIVGSEQMEDGSPGVRVLYLYPTHKAMKPCPYFLDGKCLFNESCRFSHGQVVQVSELRVFEEPDLVSLGLDKACLARHSDGMWYPGRIIDIDNSFYTVKFDSLLLKEAVLEADAIIPPLRESEDSLSDEDSEDGAEDSGFAQVLLDSEVGTTGPCSSEFAGWEAHTRGIGSKLMARMGYELGKGLGRNLEGRIEPVLAVVLPKGKSLDQCLEMKQRKPKGGGVQPKTRKKRAPKLAAAGHGKNPRRNVFDFLNDKLEGKSDKVQPTDTRTNLERKGKEVYNASQSSKRALNIEVAKTTERVLQKQREIGQITEALARNVGRDSVISVQLEKRLSDARSQLVVLQKEERSLQREQKKADTHKKMTEF